MMKGSVLFLVLIPGCIAAQNRTNVWELSYTFGISPKCELRYANNLMDTISVYRVMSFFTTEASICDTSGTLLFYSNGLTISNRNYDTLQNAVNFNPGGLTDSYEPDGLGVCQAVLILPDPGNADQYYVFHESGETFIAYSILQAQPLHLSYSVIDMNMDGGLGGIIDSLKNQYVIEDTLLNGGLTAVKHANGRDWWIIAHRFYTDKYYKFLLTPYGIQGPFEQIIGSNLMYDVDVQATFSADGSKYCITNHHGWFDYMGFDRCTGEFSNSQTIYSPDSLGLFGCSFSPNNRFLYISSRYNIYQYDTWNSNLETSAIHIAAWDSFADPLFYNDVLFFMHQIAPDGKIYISPWNGVEYLNVINSPDSFGLACDFSPHSYLLTYNGYSFNIPSFPNYDLGALQGSSCDTLNIPTFVSSTSAFSFRIYPNPVSDFINIIYLTDTECLLELYDIVGKRVGAVSLYPYFKNRLLDVSGLPVGDYIIKVIAGDKMIWSGKVVKQ